MSQIKEEKSCRGLCLDATDTSRPNVMAAETAIHATVSEHLADVGDGRLRGRDDILGVLTL
jgi:hypothetical protein